MLAKKTSTLFSKSSRMLGETFVQSDLAKVIKFDEDSITGSVEGGDSASVKLQLCGESSDDDHIHADCDCALFHRQKLCQHIWALVLLADNHRWGGTVRRFQGAIDIELGCDEDEDRETALCARELLVSRGLATTEWRADPESCVGESCFYMIAA